MATLILRSLLAAWLLPPVPSARLAAQAYDVPSSALVAITRREANGQRVGIHQIDARWSRHVCRRARAVGWIASGSDCSAGGWSTRGAFGLMAGYHLRFVGLDRWPWVLDVPLVSAIAAAKKYRTACVPTRRRRWCPRRP